MDLEKLKYPIGQFVKPNTITSDHIAIWITAIATFPQKLQNEVKHLDESQLDTPYRLHGWTIRQVVHHCADSHINSFTRFKLTLTEDQPTIKPYYEDRWAELIDSKKFPIESSLKILEGIHERWTIVLNNLTPAELKMTFKHPENGAIISIEENIGIYAWHCNHHLAHITTLKQTKNWK